MGALPMRPIPPRAYHRPRRSLCVCLTLLLLAAALLPCFSLQVGALAEEAPGDGRIGAAMVCNLENNLPLYEREADTPIYPSSSVKIMTGLLACRALGERLDECVTVTAAMLAGVTGRQMHLADGEVLTVRDLLYAAICGSYNDAAAVVASLTSGSVAAFVADMNREAERLGTACTTYTNPTGLHDPAMSTCVRDVALIAREAYKNELYMAISSARTYTIPATNASPERLFSNRNALISDSSQNYYNGYCRGLNAGMTDEGGWCVVTICERGGAVNLCIVMQGADAGTDELIPAYVYANRLLSWANHSYAYRTVVASGDVVGTSPVGMTGLSKSKAELVAATELSVYLPTDADVATEVSVTTTLTDGALTAPLTAGQVVGTAIATYDGRVVGKADLAVTEDFARNGFLDGMMAFRSYLCSRPFWLALPAFFIMLIPFLHATSGSHGRYRGRPGGRRRARYTRRR